MALHRYPEAERREGTFGDESNKPARVESHRRVPSWIRQNRAERQQAQNREFGKVRPVPEARSAADLFQSRGQRVGIYARRKQVSTQSSLHHKARL